LGGGGEDAHDRKERTAARGGKLLSFMEGGRGRGVQRRSKKRFRPYILFSNLDSPLFSSTALEILQDTRIDVMAIQRLLSAIYWLVKILVGSQNVSEDIVKLCRQDIIFKPATKTECDIVVGSPFPAGFGSKHSG
jgi:hypothetical protein